MAFFKKNRKTGELPDFFTSLPSKDENNIWYRLSDGDTVIVFVHGIFSDSRGCWLYDESNNRSEYQYWPDLLIHDTEFDGISIFLGGYFTAWDSQNYDASQASKELFSAINRSIQEKNGSARGAVLEKNTLIFVCHSTGGIVVRHLLYHNSDSFKNKTIGLVLIASPSYGSKVADKFDLLAELYNNQLGKQLQWKNPVLKALDNNFKDFVNDKKIPNLVGVEAVENHFIVHRKWLPFFTKTLLVDEDSAGKYFSSVKVLPNTNHFSCVKPLNKTHPGYVFLLDFKNGPLKHSITKRKGYNTNRYVEDLKKEIDGRLAADYERSTKKGDFSARRAREKAALLGVQLENVSDAKLNRGPKITKYEYAAYAYVVAASVESEKTKQQEYSRQALNLGAKCLHLIQDVEKEAAKGEEKAIAVLKWVNNGQDRDRIRFIMAVAHAIIYRTGGDSQIKVVQNLLNEIRPQYLEDCPPIENPNLAFVLNKEKGELTDGI